MNELSDNLISISFCQIISLFFSDFIEFGNGDKKVFLIQNEKQSVQIR